MVVCEFFILWKEKTSGNQPEVIHQSKNEQLYYKTVCNRNLGIYPK